MANNTPFVCIVGCITRALRHFGPVATRAATRRVFHLPPGPSLPSARRCLKGPAMFWLMKAEPDSRIVKGKDVKASRHSIVAVHRPI